jgi:hypothetical protein
MNLILYLVDLLPKDGYRVLCIKLIVKALYLALITKLNAILSKEKKIEQLLIGMVVMVLYLVLGQF